MRSYPIFVSLCLLTGCVSSYANSERLPFADFSYTSVDGDPWPVERLALPGIAERYGLRAPPEIAYVELNPKGERTLIFVHGLGSYLKFWRYQLDTMAASGYRVVALDMVGFGKSDKPATFPYTMPAMAEVVKELAERLQIESPVIVGHSMGGQTALALAIQYPEIPKALVLTSPAGLEKFSKREKRWFRKVMSTTFIKGTSEEAIWGSIQHNNFFRWRPELEWLVEERVRVVGTPDFDAYAYANVRSVHGLADNNFVRENLPLVRVPTVIIFGNQDRLIPNPFMHGAPTKEIMKYGHDRIKGSKLVELGGCGHTVQMDCPREYNRAVVDFLDTLE
ncbi:MAG: alpha/beta hydrolase [Deltaproteobacteria bacterium]